MDAIDVVLGIAIVCGMIWLIGKINGKIENSDKLSWDSKDGWQTAVIWLVIFGLPALIILVISSVAN